MGYSRVGLAALRIEDEAPLRRIPLYPRLKALLVRDGYRFRVSARAIDWSRAVFLNLSYWSPDDTADVVVGRSLPADVVTHVAWHHLARRALGRAGGTVDGMLLGESIASAFDVYLLGWLLQAAPRARYLETQVEAMSETTGLSPARFGKLLARIAADPNAAFSSLRALLFDASTALVRARGIDEASAVLDALEAHPLSPLLAHYNLSNWVLHSRAYGPRVPPKIDARVAKVDRALREAPVALDWLERAWLRAAEPA